MKTPQVTEPGTRYYLPSFVGASAGVTRKPRRTGSPSTARIAVGRRVDTARTAKRVDISPLWAERGLAVHNTYGGKGWTVTHLASGYAVVAGIGRHRDAITVARRLLDCGDWTVARTSLSPRLKDAARDVLAQARLLGLVGR